MFYIVIDILFYLFLVAAIVAIVRYVKHWKTLKNLKSSGNPDLFLQAAKKYEGEGQNKAAFKWYEKAAQGGGRDTALSTKQAWYSRLPNRSEGRQRAVTPHVEAGQGIASQPTTAYPEKLSFKS